MLAVFFAGNGSQRDVPREGRYRFLASFQSVVVDDLSLLCSA